MPLKDYMTKRMVRVKAAGECKLDSGCWVTKLSDDNALVREKAAWELMRIKDKGTLGALKKALGDKNAYTRLAAITAYWSFGDKSAVPEIEARLKKEEGAADFVNVNRDLKRLLVALRRR